MKQYTTPEQTAKLIELGFPNLNTKLKTQILDINGTQEVTLTIINDYSIGELLSFLPKSIKVNDLFFTLCIHTNNEYWIVEYADIAFGTQARLHKEELIDALFTEIVILKDEGII